MSYERTVQLEIFRRFSNNSRKNNQYVSEIQARHKRGVLVIYKIKLFKTLTNKTNELYSYQSTWYRQLNKDRPTPNNEVYCNVFRNNRSKFIESSY
jgi:hypothetical protein